MASVAQTLARIVRLMLALVSRRVSGAGHLSCLRGQRCFLFVLGRPARSGSAIVIRNDQCNGLSAIAITCCVGLLHNE